MLIKKMMAGGAAIATVGVVVVACGGHDDGDGRFEATQGVVIQNVTVVNTRDGSLSAGQSVVLGGGRIVKIAPSGSVRTSGAAQVVDATGKFVVPGYLDMHTHLLNASVVSANELASVQKLLVANGITGIREMGGSPAWVPLAQQINADRAAGKVDTPEILVIPGQIVGIAPTGIPSFDAGAPIAAASSTAAAIQEVQKQKAYGVNFIKTLDGNHDATLALISEAKNQGLYVAGHLNPSLSARDSSNAGWRAIEHLGAGAGILLDCATQEDSVRAAVLSGAAGSDPRFPPTWTNAAPAAPLFQRIADSYDNGKCQTVAQTFANNVTWQVPTLIRLRTTFYADDALYRTDPNLIYVSKTTRAAWEATAVQRGAFPAGAIATFRQYYNLEQTLPKLFRQYNVKMLAGSDMSINPFLTATWVIPGFSLHQEFALLAASGLATLDILQMTTLNGAEFLGRQSTMGTVDEGKNADLVLLDANPLDNVTNLDKIAAVVLRGKYLSRQALDQLKSEVAQGYAAQIAIEKPAATFDPAFANHSD